MSHCDSFCYRVLVAVIIIVVFYFSTSGEFWQLNIGNCFLYIILPIFHVLPKYENRNICWGWSVQCKILVYSTGSIRVLRFASTFVMFRLVPQIPEPVHFMHLSCLFMSCLRLFYAHWLHLDANFASLTQ